MEKLKILVVDDEARMRKLVKDFLVKDHFEVVEAEDGSQALDIFYQQKDIALIILDVMMPKVDGWEVCREVRQYSKVPVIMLTAKADERDELQGFQLGAIEYIHKQLVAQRDAGKGVLLISLELDEVMNVSDRILVMYEGEIVGEFDPEKVTVEELGLYMAGSKRKGAGANE